MRVNLIVVFAIAFVAAEGRFLTKRSINQGSAMCSANGRSYNNGDEIVYHNITNPVTNAKCTSCHCSNGVIDQCYMSYCDFEYALIQACEEWTTGVEGVCCPQCECTHASKRMKVGDSWTRRLESNECIECFCTKSHSSSCFLVSCPPCNGVEVPLNGKCCPECQPAVTQPTSFIIATTATTEPGFPPDFPWNFDDNEEAHRNDKSYQKE